jgi:hypothetical protein
MKRLGKVSRTTKRLFLLSALTMSVAIPALAGICGTHAVICADGTSTGAVVCCATGSGYAACACTHYSAAGGFSGCFLIAGCT